MDTGKKSCWKQHWKKIVGIMACIVVFCTTYALILPAITLERQTICGIEAHSHSDACYDENHELICGLDEHTHEASCYESDADFEDAEKTEKDGNLSDDTDYTDDTDNTDDTGNTDDRNNVDSTNDTDNTNDIDNTDDRNDADNIDGTDNIDIAGNADDQESQENIEDAENGISAQADENNSFTLTYNGSTITFYPVDEEGNALPLPSDIEDIDAQDATRYIFGSMDATTDESDTVKEGIAPKIEGYAYSDATIVKDGITWSVYSVGTAGYQDGVSAFRFYTKEPVTSGQWLTYSYGNYDITLKYESTDYSGEWAIVRVDAGASDGVAMLSDDNTTGTGTDVNNRKAQSVIVITENGIKYAAGAGITKWNFEKVPGSDASYYIFTQVDGATKYLYIEPTRGGVVKLSDDKQEITVVAGTGDYAGMVRLVGDTGGEVNLFGGTASGGFGSYNDQSKNTYLTLCKVQEADLFYNINTPSMSSKGTGWRTTPSISQISQSFTDMEKLFDKPEGYYEDATGASGLPGLYRFEVNFVNDLKTSPAYTEGRMKDTWYGEERFDGWTYTTDDNITYLFEPSAEVVKNEDGTISVTATKKITQDEQKNEVMETISEEEVVLPLGSMLTGHWTEVSNVVTFYVNYTGTILDVEGDVQGRTGNKFTLSAAVGHVFYGKQKVGNDQLFASDANEQITGAFAYEFVDHFDQDDPETQIIIEYMRECTKPADEIGGTYQTKMQLDAHGATSSMVADNTLKLLKETKRPVQVSTANGANPAIDNNLCDGDHYQIRWYVMKEQTDTWHIDGVLVAKTAEIAVTKTFSGLEDDQVKEVLGIGDLTKKDSALTAERFDIAVKLGVTDKDTETEATPYIKMYPSSQGTDAGNAYTYTGTESTVNVLHSYHWTLHAITDETYTLEEEQYQLTGYDVSTAVVNYYIDEEGNSDIAYGFQTDTTGLKNGDGEVVEVMAGKTTGVSFNNYYTKKDTGAFALVKRNDQAAAEDSSGKLRGAKFELTRLDDEGNATNTVSSGETNDNGSIFFNDLAEGTYHLRETKAPDGFAERSGVWKVVVEKDQDSGKIKVTIFDEADGTDEGKLVYDGGVIDNYSVTNTPNEHLITVTKTFSGLTSTQMDELIQKSKLIDQNDNKIPADMENGYYIKLQRNISGSGEIDAGGSTLVYLCLSEAHRSQDGENTFTWHVANLAVQDSEGNNISYVLSEYNLMHEAYADTAVDVKVNGLDPEDQNNDMSASLDRGVNCYTVSGIEFQSEQSDTIAIRNRYINTFDLKLRKVDSTATDENGDPIPLKGAEFKIYGPYNESKDPTDNYTYYDDEGNPHRVYYIETVISGDDGYATITGLTLSKGENTFAYILSEDKAPEGYVEGEPQIITVNVGDDAISTPDDSSYVAGVLEYSAPNTKERDAILTLNTEKIWQPYKPNGQSVTLELYRVAHAKRSEIEPLPNIADAELVKTIILKGETDETPSDIVNSGEVEDISSIKLGVYESSPWVATWYNVPAADGKENGDHYHYFVREKPVEGYTTEYKCTPVVYVGTATPLPEEQATQRLKVNAEDGSGTEEISATLIADMADDYTVEITNTEYYELPESGGPGILPFTIGGSSMAAGSLLYGYRLRRKRERRLKR